MSSGTNIPSLKSASGAGFSFEDKAAAVLFCEMLAGQLSLGDQYGIIERIERQAGDWEPFGDLLLAAANQSGEVCKLGVSVRSNRQITAAGCKEEFSRGLWAVRRKNVFTADRDALALFSAPLSSSVTCHLHSLCQQARELEPPRLDEKVVHRGVRKIYDSFRNVAVAGANGLPGRVLRHFLIREFDFEATASKSEAEAVRLCREVLSLDTRSDDEAKRLWQAVLSIAEELRASGGAVTRERLAAKLRHNFKILDDHSDLAAWTKIRRFSRDCLDEVTTILPGGISVPRTVEHAALSAVIAKARACCVLGDSGFGKSTLVKKFAAERETTGDEVVWIKADRFSLLEAEVPNFADVADRTRRASALLVVDSLEGCYGATSLARLSHMMKLLVARKDSVWSVIVICQTPEWARVSATLVKDLGTHAALTESVECGPLGNEDFALVRSASASVDLLAQKPPLRLILKSPKMLDVLLTGQLAENRELAGEADLVEWWWDKQVRDGKPIAAEERVARQLASQMADDLCSELTPDSVSGAEEAASKLIHNRVLRRTPDGLLRFDHDLLADWSRVMHLKTLGQEALAFIRGHTENPPWLRAIRLLSQHLLDRATDLERWREILNACSTPKGRDREPSAEDLQVIDAWLEGIIFSVDPGRMLEQVRPELFLSRGWRLQRLIRRLMHVGTIPDPVMQGRFQQLDPSAAETVRALYRLPISGIWSPVLNFLILHKEEVMDMIPVELGEIAAMWARLEEYLNVKWPALAEMVIASAEKELRREVAGEYRSYSGPHGRGNKSRITIYSGAVYGGFQHPARVEKLVLKAAGRLPWDDGDLSSETDAAWRGEWHEHGSMGYGEDYVEMPAMSWPDGPTRRTSDDFFHAWFEAATARVLYQTSPEVACEATLAFLLDWPKRTLFPGHHSTGVDRYGFTFEADHMYPPFYSKGPFLAFLQHNWRPALELIIRLANFATHRYADWWPYDSKPTHIKFLTPSGEVSWLGNHQVYVWARSSFNTPHVVTCALMALEKWLEDQIIAKKPVKEAIELLYQQGHSLAFAGLLIGLGKRHPELFLQELKPLLFVRELYMHDFSAISEFLGDGYWPRDGEFINNLRREWDMLPGRRTSFLDACCSWFLGRPDLQAVLKEVGAHWKKIAETLAGEDQLVLLRWAANFDSSNWKKIILKDGEEGWQRDLPKDLQDVEAEQAHIHRQSRLTLPYQCSQLLEKRPTLQENQLEGIWKQLHDWPASDSKQATSETEDELTSSLLDDRHSRAGLLAILLCLGSEWLDKDRTRCSWVEQEVRKLLSDPPKISAYSANDIHDDGESFLARCTVRCWARSPKDQEWRSAVGSFVAVFRYRTIGHLFDEAFRVREILGENFTDLESFALAFAVVRRKAKLNGYQPKPELIKEWVGEWLPKFAKSRGPKWTDNWAKIEFIEDFPPPYDRHRLTGRRKRSRRNFGFDVGVLLAAFGYLPSLNEARNDDEREHWFNICKELLAAYIRTLPPDDVDDTEDEWRFDVWSVDEKIFDVVAARLFQCSPNERRMLWLPILDLSPAAHHHITQFLSAVLIEAIRTDPPRISTLLPIWRAMAEHLFASPRWTGKLRIKQDEVWKYVFLYGTPFTSVGDKDHAPFVHGLRDLFERHIKSLDADPYDQSSLVAFLTTEAGEQLLVDALEWLCPSWQKASSYFWERAVERSDFETLLKRAWGNHFFAIRAKPEALKAFKVLTLNLAAQQVPIALEIQRQVGSA